MKNKYKGIVALMMISFLGLSCKKENALDNIGQPVDLTKSAYVKYYNFASGAGSTAAVSVNFYANDTKVSANTSTSGLESLTGTNYGTIYPASNYSLLEAGSYSITSRVPDRAAVNPGGITSSFNATVEAGKSYTYFTSGLFNSGTKTSDSFMIEDVLPEFNTEKVFVRFVNTVSNGTSPMTLIAKNSSTNEEIAVATNVGYQGASQFVELEFGAYELFVRYDNTTENVIIRNASTNGNVSFQKGRTYTITSRGDMSVTTASNLNRPLLDNTVNR